MATNEGSARQSALCCHSQLVIPTPRGNLTLTPSHDIYCSILEVEYFPSTKSTESKIMGVLDTGALQILV